MATKNFRSTVLEPTSEFAHGDKLRFTALATVGEVLKGSFSETTIGEDGVYSVDLQYGKHRIDYKPYEGCWRHFADVEVNADTLATTLQDLALASVPVTDETVLVLQGILADAEAAKAESAALRDEAAASAAAAAEDAEKLAGVTPESIGAVSAESGYVAVKTDSYFSVGATTKKYILIELPVSENITLGLRARTLSRDVRFSNEMFISFYNYLWAGSVLGLSCNQTSTHEFTYAIYRTTDNTKTVIALSAEVPFFDTYFSVIDIMSGGNYSITAKSWSTGWTITASDDIPADLNLHGEQTVTNIGTVTGAVVTVEHEGRTYSHTDRDSAFEIDGIPLAVFDAALAEQQAGDFFESEKSIALQIFADFNLGTGEQEITGADIADVRAYIQSIDPAKGLKAGHLQRAKIPRPSIFDRYS